MLAEKIQNDALQLRKNKNRLGTVLNTVYANIKMFAKNDGNRTPNDEDAIKIVRKAIKDGEEVIEILKQKNVDYNIQQEEINLFKNYLPKEIDQITILKQCEIILGDNKKEPKYIGVIMKSLKEKYGNELNPQLASKLIKEFLAS